MHICSVYCFNNEHVEVTYTTDKGATVDMCKEVMEGINRIRVSHVREIYEFDRDKAKKAFEYCTFDRLTKVEGSSYIRDEEIRAFRFVYREVNE